MANVYEVSEKDLGRLFRQVEEARPSAIVRGIQSAIVLGAEFVARAAPKDLGELRRSCHAVLEAGGGYIEVDAPHAGFVEMGTRPHVPPLEPLIGWAMRHGNPDTAVQFARAIQRKIAREGTKPVFFMRRSLPALRKLLKAEVEREIAKG